MNWKRRFEAFIDNKRFANTEFDMAFMVDFEIKEEPNRAVLTIYNLSDTTVNSCIKEGNACVINAGYEDDAGMIFAGVVTGVKVSWENVDKKVEITAYDASRDYLQKFVSKTYKEGAMASEIVRDLFGQTGLSLGALELKNDIQYPKGKTVHGRLREIVEQICRVDCGTPVQVINGMIMAREIGAGIGGGFLLNKETGLIGSPEKVEMAAGQKTYKANYNITCLLNHNIGCMVALKVESRTLNGNCIVAKGCHRGSETGDYYTEVEVIVP